MQVSRADGGAIAVELVGAPYAAPVLFCHGLADTRLSARDLAAAAQELGLRLVAPDRPGIGGTTIRPLAQVADWVEDAALVLRALRVDAVAVLGVSAGGAYAVACAAALGDRVRRLVLVAPLGPPSWPTRGMAAGQRLVLPVAARAPQFGGWVLGRLAVLARSRPALFVRLATSGMPGVDRRTLARTVAREAFLANYREAFRAGDAGVAQDLRLLTRPWGVDLRAVTAPTWIHHGDADTTVPLGHARRFADAIPGAQLRIHRGHGHFSILGDPRPVLAALSWR